MDRCTHAERAHAVQPGLPGGQGPCRLTRFATSPLAFLPVRPPACMPACYMAFCCGCGAGSKASWLTSHFDHPPLYPLPAHAHLDQPHLCPHPFLSPGSTSPVRFLAKDAPSSWQHPAPLSWRHTLPSFVDSAPSLPHSTCAFLVDSAPFLPHSACAFLCRQCTISFSQHVRPCLAGSTHPLLSAQTHAVSPPSWEHTIPSSTALLLQTMPLSWQPTLRLRCWQQAFPSLLHTLPFRTASLPPSQKSPPPVLANSQSSRTIAQRRMHCQTSLLDHVQCTRLRSQPLNTEAHACMHLY